MLIMRQGLVSLLQNPHALMEHGQMILDGRKSSHNILESPLLEECTVVVIHHDAYCHFMTKCS